MNLRLGVNCEQSRAEFVRKLSRVDHEQVELARQSLFDLAVEKRLANMGDVLVKCKSMLRMCGL